MTVELWLAELLADLDATSADDAMRVADDLGRLDKLPDTERRTLASRLVKAAARLGIMSVLLECTSPFRERDLESVEQTLGALSVHALVDAPSGGAVDDSPVAAFARVSKALRAARQQGANVAHAWLIDRVLGLVPAELPDLGQRFAGAVLPLIQRRVHARLGLGRTDHAADIVQEVWCVLLGTGGITKWMPGGRKLTGFIRMLVDRTMYNLWRDGMRQKRGGQYEHVSYEALGGAADAVMKRAYPSGFDMVALYHWLSRRSPAEREIMFDVIDGRSVEQIRRRTRASHSSIRLARDEVLRSWGQESA